MRPHIMSKEKQSISIRRTFRNVKMSAKERKNDVDEYPEDERASDAVVEVGGGEGGALAGATKPFHVGMLGKK